MSALAVEPEVSTGRKVLSFFGFSNENGTEPRLRLFRQHEETFQAIVTIDGNNFEATAPEIAYALQDYIPIILNLTGVKPNEGRRILDFAIGGAMVLGGTIKRVNRNVFVIAPPNVSLNDEDAYDMNAPL